MLIVKIAGGLGHQLFQYGLGRACAERLGVELKLDLSGLAEDGRQAPALLRLGLQVPVASGEEILEAQRRGRLEERSLHFDPALLAAMADGLHVAGGFLDHRYHEPVVEALRRELLPRVELGPESRALLERIQGGPSVSLHVRRGDHVTDLGRFLLPPTYGQDAVERVLQRCPEATVFVFSDDPDWVVRHLQLPAPTVVVGHNGPTRDVEDLRLMAACQHHVVANSAFSYWAARLDGRPGGLTIAPQQWFRPGDPDLMGAHGEVRQPRHPAAWDVLPVRVQGAEPAAPRYLGIAGGEQVARPMRVGVWSFYDALSRDGFLFKNPDAPIGQDLLKPFCELHRYGQAHGIQFETLDRLGSPEEADALLFLDYPTHADAHVQRFLASDRLKYLMLFETEMIKPDNWSPEVHARFDRIFTWNDALVDANRYVKFNFAVEPEPPFDLAALQTAFHSRRLCTLIAGAKAAAHANELYSERVRAIRWFERNAPADLDLYGVGWDPAQFPSYRGPVRRKLSALAGYRFAICYENAVGYPGYITEKLLDCLLAGVVPVYAGAPNVTRWIPADCFLRLEDFPDYPALHAHLRGMGAAEHGAYLDRIQAFLRSPRVHPFSIEGFVSTVTSTLARDVSTVRRDAPRVSVMIPAYNNGAYLEQAIRSALTQEVERLEVVVLDNASTDDTPEVAARFAGDPRFRYVRNLRNVGAQANWNNALRLAKGDYVAILSSDDYFLPGHLARLTGLLDHHPTTALAYCPISWVQADGRPLLVARHPGYAPASYAGGRNEVADLLRHDCYITPSAAVMRRAAVQSVGEYDLQLKGAIDWDLWIRLAERHPDFAFSATSTVCYRRHAKQDTQLLESSAGLFVDHVAILRKALDRGSLRLFQGHVADVISLLRRKFGHYPREWVAHLIPDIDDLVRRMEAGGATAVAAASPRPGTLVGGPPVAAAPPAPAAGGGAGREALLLDCDWAGTGWVEVLLAYFEAFAPGDPVTLVLYVEPGREGQVSADRARGALLHLARSTGRASVPDVALVDSAAGLVELLRGHQRSQWVPGRPGAGEGFHGGPGQRLAEARRRLTARAAPPRQPGERHLPGVSSGR